MSQKLVERECQNSSEEFLHKPFTQQVDTNNLEDSKKIVKRNLPLLSVVVPCFNEGTNVCAFYRAIKAEFDIHNDIRYEIIFINDGSSDNTQDELINLAKTDSCITVIEFSRNFGKEAALTAGLRQSHGDVVAPMDADLQHPPSVLFQLWDRFKEGDADVVIAKRKSRDGESKLYKVCTKWFYQLESAISDCQMPRDAGDFRLMSRKVVNVLDNLPEKRRFMKGLYAWVGFRTVFVDYEVAPRISGVSKFSPMRLVALAANGILDFSSFPLRFWGILGSIVSLISLIFGLWIVISTLCFGGRLPGYASLITAIVFLGGIQLLSIGVVGEYIGRLYSEVKGRPTYVIRSIVGKCNAN